MLIAKVPKRVQQHTTQQQREHPDTCYKQRVCFEQVLEVAHEEVKGSLLAAEASKTAVLRKLERQSSSMKDSIKVTLHSPKHNPCSTVCPVLEA